MSNTLRGHRNHHAGLAAEDGVERLYEAMGYLRERRRWRGAAGEIDLIFRKGAGVVFVEVKKSADTLRAAEHLSARQMARISRAAEEFLADEPSGLSTPARIDVALVDATGRVSLIENATLA